MSDEVTQETTGDSSPLADLLSRADRLINDLGSSDNVANETTNDQTVDAQTFVADFVAQRQAQRNEQAQRNKPLIEGLNARLQTAQGALPTANEVQAEYERAVRNMPRPMTLREEAETQRRLETLGQERDSQLAAIAQHEKELEAEQARLYRDDLKAASQALLEHQTGNKAREATANRLLVDAIKPEYISLFYGERDAYNNSLSDIAWNLSNAGEGESYSAGGMVGMVLDGVLIVEREFKPRVGIDRKDAVRRILREERAK